MIFLHVAHPARLRIGVRPELPDEDRVVAHLPIGRANGKTRRREDRIRSEYLGKNVGQCDFDLLEALGDVVIAGAHIGHAHQHRARFRAHLVCRGVVDVDRVRRDALLPRGSAGVALVHELGPVIRQPSVVFDRGAIGNDGLPEELALDHPLLLR